MSLDFAAEIETVAGHWIDFYREAADCVYGNFCLLFCRYRIARQAVENGLILDHMRSLFAFDHNLVNILVAD